MECFGLLDQFCMLFQFTHSRFSFGLVSLTLHCPDHEGLEPLVLSVLITHFRHGSMLSICFARLLAKDCDILGLAHFLYLGTMQRAALWFFFSWYSWLLSGLLAVFDCSCLSSCLPHGAALSTNEASVDVDS